MTPVVFAPVFKVVASRALWVIAPDGALNTPSFAKNVVEEVPKAGPLTILSSSLASLISILSPLPTVVVIPVIDPALSISPCVCDEVASPETKVPLSLMSFPVVPSNVAILLFTDEAGPTTSPVPVTGVAQTPSPLKKVVLEGFPDAMI